jgi:hypothetical protein
MYKRPTPRPLQPNVKNVPIATMMYKGISNNARIYETPVFFTFSRNYARTYAKARLGEYAAKKPLKLLHLTKKTLKYLLAHSELSQLNKNRLAFIMGANMTVKNQLQFLNKIVQNNSEKAFRLGVMRNNLLRYGKTENAPGGRKSFMNLDLTVYKSLCAFCRRHGYDGIYVDELTSPFHNRFGAELALCNPRNSILNINFPLKSG